MELSKQVDGTPGTFWLTPANTKNGPHRAITSVEILTIRVGKMGVFGQLPT